MVKWSGLCPGVCRDHACTPRRACPRDHIANDPSADLTFRPSRDGKGQSWCALALLLALALMLLSSCSIFLSSPGLSAGHERDSRGHRATHMRDPAALTTRSRQRIAEHDCSHRPRTPAPARAHNTIVDARVRMHSCELDTQQRAAGSHRTACTSNGGQARGDRDAPYLEVERHRPQEFMRRPCRLRRAACTSATAAAEHTEASEQWQRRPRAATRQNASAE